MLLNHWRGDAEEREREEGEGELEKGRGGKGSLRSLIMCTEKKLDSRGNVTMVVLKTNR